MPHGDMEVPELPGWLTVPDAAKLLNLSRQAVHLMVQAGQFKSARRIGQHCYVVQLAEVDEILLRREQSCCPDLPAPLMKEAAIRVACCVVRAEAKPADLAELLDMLGVLYLLRELRADGHL